MIYNPNIPIDLQRAKDRFKWLISKGKTFELKEKRQKRSLSQNRYLHLLFEWFAIETGYTADEVKQEIFKKHINADIFYVEQVDNIISIERWRSTADLKTDEVTICIDRFRDFASKELGIYLPEPNDLAIINQMENELNKYQNKVYK